MLDAGVTLEPPQRLLAGGQRILTSGRNETISARANPPSATRCISGGSKLHSSSSDTTRKTAITRNGHSSPSQTRSANRASQLSRTLRSKRLASALSSAPWVRAPLGEVRIDHRLHLTRGMANDVNLGSEAGESEAR